MTKAPQFTAKASINLQRIHVDRPAQSARVRQVLDFRQPAAEETLQSGSNRRFYQQVRTEMIGAARNQGSRRPEDLDRALACSSAGGGGGPQEGVQCRAVLRFGAQQ